MKVVVGSGVTVTVGQVVPLRERVRGVVGEEEGEELKVIPRLTLALPLPGCSPPPTGESVG